jgi:hypothetical protein
MPNLELKIISCVILSNNINSPALEPLVVGSIFINSSNLLSKKTEISLENLINE